MTTTMGAIGRVAARASLVVLIAGVLAPVEAQSLRGGTRSMDIQNQVARQHDFTFLRSGSQVRRFVEAGYLVPVRGNRDFDLHAVSYPYARPEAELFIRRLASQYRRACGEKLVVTSLTRPMNGQPRNASTRSVHPTGMAIDLRRSGDARCRAWLEGVLLDLERKRVLEATRERRPPHYHIALFPNQYRGYVERITGRPAQVKAQIAANVAPASSGPTEIVDYRVRSGESLWTIARDHGTTVAALQAENDLRSSRIVAGQTLKVPVRSR